MTTPLTEAPEKLRQLAAFLQGAGIANDEVTTDLRHWSDEIERLHRGRSFTTETRTLLLTFDDPAQAQLFDRNCGEWDVAIMFITDPKQWGRFEGVRVEVVR